MTIIKCVGACKNEELQFASTDTQKDWRLSDANGGGESGKLEIKMKNA